MAAPRPQPNETPDLAARLWGLARQWRLILSVTLGAASLASVTILHHPRHYTASGTILYDPRPAAIGGERPADFLPTDDAMVASQAGVIASAATIGALVAKFGGTEASARAALGVKVQPGSHILAVAFTDTDPVRAASAANLAMSLYIGRERAQARAALADGQDWVEHRLAAAAAALNRTQERIAAARLGAGVVEGSTGSLDAEAASRAGGDLAGAEADLATASARLAAIGAGQGASPSPAEAADIAPLRQDEASLEARVQSLARIYGAAYPDLVSAKAALAAVQGRIAAVLARGRAAAAGDAAAARRKVDLLTAETASVRRSVAGETKAAASIEALEQQEAGQRAIVTELMEQSEQAVRAIALRPPDARILSPAAPPASPDQPGRVLLFAATLVAGFALGVLAALHREEADRSIRSARALAEAAGLPCLAALPEAAAPQDLPLREPFSAFAEQIRALRTALFHAPGMDTQARVLAFVAARPAEGKTTLAISLARDLAAAGKRVVVVDGDLRQPTFEAAFALGAVPGLTDFLAGEADLAAILARDPLSPLAVIPAGGRARGALTLFLSPALPALLASLRTEFDMVILDVPPAFAVAEGRVLARAADRAVLCVRWGDTPRPIVEAAIGQLRDAGVTLAGFVLTRVDAAAIRRAGLPESELYHPRYGGYFRA